MTLAYDDVVSRLVSTAEDVDGFATKVERALLIRTTDGRVRLALEFDGEPTAGLCGRVEHALTAQVGAWFSGPVISTRDPRPSMRQLAQALMREAKERLMRHGWAAIWPTGWPTETASRPGATSSDLDPRWLARQVALGKEPWMHQGDRASPPWPMLAHNPKITHFMGIRAASAGPPPWRCWPTNLRPLVTRLSAWISTWRHRG